MGDQFKWQFDESLDERPQSGRRQRFRAGAASFWITAVLLIAVVIGGWALLRWQRARSAQALVDATQASLDLLAAAVAEGDGELFFALQDGDAAWFAAQLRPEQIDFYRAGPKINNVQQAGAMLHANAVWQQAGKRYQRVLFFDRSSEQPRQVATDPAYWGEDRQVQQLWGQLNYQEVDEPWVPAISTLVNRTVDTLCAGDCVPTRLPVTLEIRSDFLDTAEPGHLAVPSPRLLGLDEAGQPSDRFWQALEKGVTDYLTPATVRFAVPPEPMWDIEPRLWRRIDYEAAAEAFMAERPDIQIELVPMESLPVPLPDIDGAAFAPTIAMIAGGQVVDLTPFVLSDPQFDPADFYEQIWQGATWHDRLWIMPQAVQLPLIFYQRDAYRSLELEEPLIGWTWSELSDDALELAKATISGRALAWGYLDQTPNTLFSYAFSHQSQCGTLERHPCPVPLSDEDIAAALAWYFRLAVDEGIMPDPSRMNDDDRERLLINALYETAIWADEPVYFEHRTANFPMGVLPFPGSDHVASSTPLWVEGSFISRESKRPLATWEWLKFLSSWPPSPHYRLIPARPSVGQESQFWARVPRPIVEPMRVAFPLARPVSLADRAVFDWARVRAVMDGKITPLEAAQGAREITWFAE